MAVVGNGITRSFPPLPLIRMIRPSGDFKPTPSNWFLLETKKKIPKAYFKGGHSYCEVEDVARGHVAAMACGRVGERYVLAGDNIAIRDFLSELGHCVMGDVPSFVLATRMLEWLDCFWK